MLGSGAAGASSWLDVRAEIDTLTDAREFDLARAEAVDYVALIAESFGPDSAELAEAELLLAGILRRLRDFDAAELAQIKAIEIFETRAGPAATTLIDPLVGLGEIYFSSGRFELATSAYEEARSIGRRSYGLLNQDQLAILNRMASVALAEGDFDKAIELRREALAIVQRFHGEDSLEFVEASFDYAKWLVSRRAYDDAMRAYLDLDKQIANNFEDDPLLMVRLLQSSADFLRNAGPPVLRMRTNPAELERALDIVESFDVPDPALKAEILRDIGDWNVSLALGRRIANPYREAWELLGTVENGDELRDEWFSGHAMIREVPLRSRALSSEDDAPWGRVEIAYTLDIEGRASGIEIVRSDPSGLIDEAAMRHIASARFRPRISGGELVASRNVVAWNFQYDPARTEAYGEMPVAAVFNRSETATPR